MCIPFKTLVIEVLAPCVAPVVALGYDDYLDKDIEWYQYPLIGGQAGFVSLKLAPGITLHHARVRFEALAKITQHIDYCQAHVTFTEPVLQVHCVLNGRATRRDILSGAQYAIDEEHVYVNMATNANFITAIDADALTDSIHLTVSLSALIDLLGAQSAQDLCERVQAGQTRTYNLGPAVLSALRYGLDQDLPFAMRKLRAYAGALEFLSGLAMYFLSRVPPVRYDGSPALDLRDIKSYLRQHARDCVTLQDLAQAFGVSTRTINNHLLRQTGMPAARFMREQKLALAHELIQQTDLSVSELAHRCGYRHLSNFSIAFRKMYGYSPTQLRQSTLLQRPNFGGSSQLSRLFNLPGN